MIKQKRKRQKLNKPPTKKMNYNNILGHGVRFTQADLTMNRRGLLSDRQYEKRLTRLVKRDRNIWVSYICAFFTVFIALGIILSRPELMLHVHTIVSITGSIIIAILLVLVYFDLRKAKRLRQELNKRVVKYVVGPVTVSTIPHHVGNGNTVYQPKIRVWDAHFHVSQRGAESFRHLDKYVIYYLPHTRIVVSAEPV